MLRHRLAASLAALAIAVLIEPSAARTASETQPQQANPATQATPSAPPANYPAVPLLSTGESVLGETIQYPKAGPAHVTAAIVTLAPGERTTMHMHGVPMFAYILEGEITVDYGEHGKRIFRQGQSLIEAMSVPHFGTNTGAQPMRLIAVYMGAKGAENVIPVK